jgi:hypothetical protein
MMCRVVDRLPVSQATVALRVPRSRRGSPLCLSIPSANSDHSFRAGAALARGTGVRLAGARRSRGGFAATTLKQPANQPTSIVGGGFSHA